MMCLKLLREHPLPGPLPCNAVDMPKGMCNALRLRERGYRFVKIISFISILLFPFISLAGQKAAVVSADVHATEVGKKILMKGGNAADAAVAMSFVLSVTEPQNSGIGGGGVLIYYNKLQNTYSYLDYLPQAPLQAEAYHLKSAKKKTETDDELIVSKTGSSSIAIPGLVMGMDMLHKRFGHLKWSELFEDAVGLAENGFEVSPELARVIEKQSEVFKDQNNFLDFFKIPLLDKKPQLIQKNLALTLKKISESGAQGFYYESLGKAILGELDEVHSLIVSEDWQTYRAYFREPHKFLFQDNIIMAPSFPSVGGLLLEHLLRASHANQMSFESKNYPVFIEKQLKEFYSKNSRLSDTKENILGHTTHFSIIDAEGNIATVTNSLGDAFGSGIVLSGSGFVLNNMLYDYFESSAASADLIRRKKRAITHLTPLIVNKGFDPVLVMGTSGGKTIPVNLFHVMQQNLIEKKSLKNAIKAPKFYAFPDQKVSVYEKGFSSKQIPKNLEYKVSESMTTAGNIQTLSKIKSEIKVESDPRGEGVGEVFVIDEVKK